MGLAMTPSCGVAYAKRWVAVHHRRSGGRLVLCTKDVVTLTHQLHCMGDALAQSCEHQWWLCVVGWSRSKRWRDVTWVLTVNMLLPRLSMLCLPGDDACVPACLSACSLSCPVCIMMLSVTLYCC
jgi:hypothetical protein